MSDLYWGRSLLLAAALWLSSVLVPVAVFPDRPQRTTGGSPEALPGAVEEDGAAESEAAKFSREQLEVFRVNQRFYRALSSQSLRAMGKVWLQESWVKCVHPSWALLTGWKRIRKSWATIFRNTEHMEIQPSEISIRVNGDFCLGVLPGEHREFPERQLQPFPSPGHKPLSPSQGKMVPGPPPCLTHYGQGRGGALRGFQALQINSSMG